MSKSSRRAGLALTGSGHSSTNVSNSRANWSMSTSSSAKSAASVRQYKQKLDLPKTAACTRTPPRVRRRSAFFIMGVPHACGGARDVEHRANSSMDSRTIWRPMFSRRRANAGPFHRLCLRHGAGAFDPRADGMVKVFPRRIDLENTRTEKFRGDASRGEFERSEEFIAGEGAN